MAEVQKQLAEAKSEKQELEGKLKDVEGKLQGVKRSEELKEGMVQRLQSELSKKGGAAGAAGASGADTVSSVNALGSDEVMGIELRTVGNCKDGS